MTGSSAGRGTDGPELLALEPYYGGSHRQFIDGLLARLPVASRLLTLPARGWKWRMRLAAPFFADIIRADPSLGRVRTILCSAFVDVALLKSLLPPELAAARILVYFHENQFAYPVRIEDERDIHFGITNLTSVLAADGAAFNSAHNLETFMDGASGLLKLAPDMRFSPRLPEELRKKCRVIHPGIDLDEIDMVPRQNSPLKAGAAVSQRADKDGAPVVVWNHRWEHDKGPELFFSALEELDREGVPFRLVVLGREFSARPDCFDRAEKRFAGRIAHFGHAADRGEYLRLLRSGDVVVSTARHEFYGIAVIEAVRCGLRPVLPDALSYPELFGGRFLYRPGELTAALRDALRRGPLGDDEARKLTQRFGWNNVLQEFCEWLMVEGE